jgi:hypothetical protein
MEGRMRTDPTDNGGLFIGRRPGTRPVHYRALPQRAGAGRQALDRALAAAVLALMTAVNLLFWGPVEVAWLWVGSQIDYVTSSLFLGIVSAFLGVLATLMFGLVVLKRLDQAWILVRRAGGYDQRSGILGRVFVISCGLGTAAFSVWLLLFSGASLVPVGMHL